MTTTERAIKTYVRKVDRALRNAGAERRREIVDEIETHIREELSQMEGDPTDAQVADVLDRVGDPSEIAAPEGGEERSTRFPLQGVTALTLLLAGGLLYFPFGWLVGVLLLWSCDRWNLREKILGTSVVPLGLTLPIYVWMSGCGTSNPVFVEGEGTDYVCDWFGVRRTWMIAFVVLLVLASLVTTAYLSKRLRNPTATGYSSRSVVTSPFILVLLAVVAIGWFSTTEVLLRGAGKEGDWKVVASWRFQYCLTYQHALGEGGACGIEQPDDWTSRDLVGGQTVYRLDEPLTAVTGVVPRGVSRVELVTESGRHIETEFSRVLNMTFYAALVPGTQRVDIVAFDEEGNVIDE